MEIVFSDHARMRMGQRGISLWEVKHVLEFPDETRNSSEGRKIAIGMAGTRSLRVVFIEVENYIKIITVL
ncbi:DUF4258 domain-containing protein [Candidatus Woesearchaeota archaeon]|nr:DUF4258 domain-containing protein [Candidatus Woesearchaeota archaeon]